METDVPDVRDAAAEEDRVIDEDTVAPSSAGATAEEVARARRAVTELNNRRELHEREQHERDQQLMQWHADDLAAGHGQSDAADEVEVNDDPDELAQIDERHDGAETF